MRMPALQVSQGHDFHGQLLEADIVAFEFDPPEFSPLAISSRSLIIFISLAVNFLLARVRLWSLLNVAKLPRPDGIMSGASDRF